MLGPANRARTDIRPYRKFAKDVTEPTDCSRTDIFVKHKSMAIRLTSRFVCFKIL
jgi:hypothetical protein